MTHAEHTNLILARAERHGEHRIAYLVGYPGQDSEFEIQAFLLYELRALGYDVRGEVTTRCDRFRFDLVVFKGRVAVRIIEVKKHKRPIGYKKVSVRRQRQAIRDQISDYSTIGLPVDCVRGMARAKAYVARATNNPGSLLVQGQIEPPGMVAAVA